MPLLTHNELAELLVAQADQAPVPEIAVEPAHPWNVLTTRRSVRQFADREVDLDALAGVLRPGRTEIAVAVGSGLHLWTAERLGRQIAGAEVVAALRNRYAPAPVIVLFFATPTDLAGHYAHLVEAGQRGYETWLAALGLGLAGCPFGLTSTVAVEAFRQAGRPAARQLFTLALGWPR